MNLSTSLQRHRVNRFLRTPKNLHREQSKLFRAARQEHHRICNSACFEIPGPGATSATVHTIAVENAGFELALVQWSVLGHELPDQHVLDHRIIASYGLIAPLVTMSCRLLLRRVASRGVLPRERFRPLEQKQTWKCGSKPLPCGSPRAYPN